MENEYDVIIIGAGVIGSFVARHLMEKKLALAVLEKEDDVCCGVSKAHSAIVHCGYSGKPGALKSKMTVIANENFHNVCEELDVPFRRCGSIIIARSAEGVEKLQEKLRCGRENGVKEMYLLNREETLAREPNVKDDIIASVYAPATGTVNPWEYCTAAMENAMDNGAELFLNHTVLSIVEQDGVFNIETNNGNFRCQQLINCAGLCADEINNMIEEPFFQISPRKGEYIVLDKELDGFVNGFIFQARGEDEPKGVFVSPTIHGNIMVGPSAEDVDDKEDRSNTIEGLSFIQEVSQNSVKPLPFDKMITCFAGLRPRPSWLRKNEQGEIEAYEDKTKDFIIQPGKKHPHFLNVAGIKSPGFTCSDEIGKYVAVLVSDNGDFTVNEDYNPRRRKRLRFADLNHQECNREIQKDPALGKIVCKCNLVTESEIRDVILRNAGARTVDGVKRRTAASMGKCHGSHCRDRIQDILNEVLQHEEL